MGKALRICAFLGLGLWVVYLFLYNLGASPFENWDEAFYADGIRSMVRSHDFIIPYWNQAVFIDKPPLYYWLGVLSTSIFGLTEWAIRLPSALAAMLTVYLCGWYMYRRHGMLSAFVTMLVLVANGLYIYRSRGANLDGVATLWIVISFIVIHSRSRYMPVLYGVCVGLVYLTKASLAYYLVPIFCIHLANQFLMHAPRTTHALRDALTQIFYCLASAILLPTIWLLSAYAVQGWEYVRYFLFSSDQGTARFSFKNANLEYIRYMRESVGIWFGSVALVGYLHMFRDVRRHLIPILYGMLLLVMLSLSHVHANWYLLPVLPFAAMAVGYSVRVLRDRYLRPRGEVQALLIPMIVLTLFLFQYARIYRRIITHIFTNHSTVSQKITAEYAKRITRVDEQIVRLDDLYPATIYYADRKVLISKVGASDFVDPYIPRSALTKRMQVGEIQVILGKRDEVERVLKQAGSGKIVFESGDEAVGVVGN
ncbi:MAG: glycosyltransferase family 39 protein [bacterium]